MGLKCTEFHFYIDEFKALQIKKLYFWMDNSLAHFRTYEMQYYLYFLGYNQPFGFICKWNYFVEGHAFNIINLY